MEGIGGGEIMLTSVFVATESAFAYSAMLPSLMTMATFVDSPEKIAAIRQGEIVATSFAGILATAVSIITKSLIPLIMTTLACGFMVIVYEWGLRRSPAWGGN